jgi:hypothetical protein
VVVIFNVGLGVTGKRLSDVYGGVAGTPDETKNIPYRQFIIQALGADGFIGAASSVTASNGYKLAVTATVPFVLGPFETGPVKLSDLWAAGAGSTLNIIGVPF